MSVRRSLPAVGILVVAFAASACGGGGGGSAPGGVAIVPTPTPTPGPNTTPNTVPGFTSASGAFTLITAVNGNLGSDLLPSSADGVLIAQVASTPSEPPSGGSLTQFNVTVKENAGTSPSSLARIAQTTHSTLAQRIAEDRAARAADDLREMTPNVSALRRTFATLRAQPVTRATSTVRRTQAAKATVGQQRTFQILTSNIGNSGGCAGGTSSGTYQCNVTITATAEAVGTYANVWVDNASLATQGEFTNVPAEFQTVASDFDAYYATETNAFGPAWFPGSPTVTPTYSSALGQCDATGTQLPRSSWKTMDETGAGGTSIDVVITDALAGTGEGGYYYVGNEFPQEVWNCAAAPKPVSNNTAMFVITGNNYTTGPNLPQFNESYWLNTDIPRSMSHEFQHLLHAHNKVLYPFVTGGNSVFDDAFLDEGCSMLAEDIAANGIAIDTPRYTYSFMLEPSLFSLTSFTGYQPNPTSTATNPPYGWYSNTAGSYGQAYLFVRYLYDRFGPGVLKGIYAGTGSSVATVQQVSGESFAQLYREFTTAVAAQSSPVVTTPYTLSSAITLRGTINVTSRRIPQSTRVLTFGGPQPPELFANNLVIGSLTLTPPTTGTTFVVDGGALYLPAANSSTGAAIVVSGATGATNFEGSLVQGALPTPTPASL